MLKKFDKAIAALLPYFQCPFVFEKRFITTTPAMIRRAPSTKGKSILFLKTNIPTIAVNTIPTPDQIA